tara:strand:+ start:29 stop:523 length:495 start_codon:yes stop_codon:yes gene_type:complete
MKRLLIPLLAAIALPTALNAQISDKIHNRCKDASDYMGCVKANSDNKLSIKSVEKTQPKKQRPAWMVQKLKGCFKYADETKKNYCIKTYSPYGNPIPENLNALTESGGDSERNPTRYYKNPNSYNSQQNQKIRQLQMQQQTERYKKSLEQYGRYYNHPQYDYGY